jgi:hypothetical protein
MMRNTRSIRIDINSDLHRRMKIAAARMDTTVTGLARSVMLRALAEIEAGDVKADDKAARITSLVTV